MNRPIGIYDSGVGGLTVFRALRERFPYERFVYFGDTLNLPYGNKSKAQIIEYSRQIIAWFQNSINAKLVIAACHTSSALALDDIRHEFKVPVIGTIYPLLNALLNNNEYKKIGIIATPASAESRIHEKIFLQHGFKGEVYSIGCPEFVPLIESNLSSQDALKMHAKKYLSIFEEKKLDTLIYGCTHYPFIKSIIEDVLPPNTQTIDPANYIATEAYEVLQKQALLNTIPLQSETQFYCSDNPDLFASKIDRYLGNHQESSVLIQPQVTLIDLHRSLTGDTNDFL